jgi:hypothetical protein
MTEEEAKQKWCPFAKTTDENHGTYNRTGGQFEPKYNDKHQPLFADQQGNEGTATELRKLWAQNCNKMSDLSLTRLGQYIPSAPDTACLCLGSACMAWIKTSMVGEIHGRCGLIPNKTPL